MPGCCRRFVQYAGAVQQITCSVGEVIHRSRLAIGGDALLRVAVNFARPGGFRFESCRQGVAYASRRFQQLREGAEMAGDVEIDGIGTGHFLFYERFPVDGLHLVEHLQLYAFTGQYRRCTCPYPAKYGMGKQKNDFSHHGCPRRAKVPVARWVRHGHRPKYLSNIVFLYLRSLTLAHQKS